MASIVKRGKTYSVVYYEGEGSNRHQVWESGLSYTQNIVRLEVDDGNGIQVIDIDSGKPFAIVLPLNVGNICFYDTNGNVVEYLRQQL